jgi:hypothetical protein
MAIAIVGDHRFSLDQLQGAGLPAPPFGDLASAGFVEADAGSYRLTSVARHGLRRELESLLRPPHARLAERGSDALDPEVPTRRAAL